MTDGNYPADDPEPENAQALSNSGMHTTESMYQSYYASNAPTVSLIFNHSINEVSH